MNQEIEKLIDFALKDGVLTHKEKQVLYKKAEAMGVDMDEFEILLEAKLFEKTSINQTSNTNKTEKIGEIKKCPSCGAVATAFSSSCSECGFEYRNISANKSVKSLSEKLENVVLECNKMTFEETNLLFKLTDNKNLQQERRDAEILSRQRDVIINFPIPNTREDILELLHFILPKIKTGISSDKNYSAWRVKFVEILNRAKIAFSNDSRMISELLILEKQSKLSQMVNAIRIFKELPKKTRSTIFAILLFSLCIYSLNRMISSHQKEVEKERARLELILNKVNEAISVNKYDEGENLANQLIWEGPSGEKSDQQLIKSWDQKREGILNTIRNLKSEKNK